MTEQSEPQISPVAALPRVAQRLDQRFVQNLEQEYNVRNNVLIPCESFLSSKLIAQLELWQHDGQFVRWCRLIRDLQQRRDSFSVVGKKRKFVLHWKGSIYKYRARRSWKPLDSSSPMINWLSNEARLQLKQCEKYQLPYTLWWKQRPWRVHLFVEQTGESYYCYKSERSLANPLITEIRTEPSGTVTVLLID